MNTASVSPSGQPHHGPIPKSEIARTIQRAVQTLAAPDQVVELRILGVNGKRIDSGYFNDPARLAQAATQYDGRAEGIYITLNPVNPALIARSNNRVREFAKTTTTDDDVTQRHWIFIDLDPVRPSGISSSAAEHDAAIARGRACQAWLASQQIAAGIADSGNGCHVLIPIRLPNTEASTVLVKHVLKAIVERFSDAVVKVDTSTTNAGHLIKLYGTMACKGDSVVDRPHRRSGLLNVPSRLDPVSISVLQSLVPNAESPIQAPSPQPLRPNRDNSDHSAIDRIKQRFDMVAFAERERGTTAVREGDEYRLPGQQGFLLDPDKGRWYHHGGGIGGDALDLVGYLRYGASWNKHDKIAFQAVLREAAEIAGVALARPINAQAIPNSSEHTVKSLLSRRKVDVHDAALIWAERYGQDYAWDSSAGAWRKWTGTHWQVLPDAEALDLITIAVLHELGLSVMSMRPVDSTVRLARDLCGRKFSPRRGMVNFQNGTLDTATMAFRDHEREDDLIGCLPYSYSGGQAFPKISRFLEMTIPDADGRLAYMSHLGAAMLADTSLHKALVLFGPTRSGKSSLLQLAQLVMGYHRGSAASGLIFAPSSPGANSRAVWADATPQLVCLDEFPEKALRDDGEDMFKAMVAHGGVPTRHIYGKERPANTWTAKLLFATNNRLHYTDRSHALTERLILVECPNVLPEAHRDPFLLSKLEPELAGFAQSCLDAALAVLRTGRYPISQAMRDLLDDIERNGDSAKLWLSERCEIQPEGCEPTQALYEDYRRWCDGNGVRAISRPRLRDAMLSFSRAITAIKRRIIDPETGESKPLWCLSGVRLLAS